ncbi:hypothetical protein GCM10022254_71600 [Actinomadura meridiana]|uniref:Uncharacterized protein n=1 Tax=Actinomadura meridiana TaxID=559626 RepID=A0ABP8CP16_9ACTN
MGRRVPARRSRAGWARPRERPVTCTVTGGSSLIVTALTVTALIFTVLTAPLLHCYQPSSRASCQPRVGKPFRRRDLRYMGRAATP